MCYVKEPSEPVQNRSDPSNSTPNINTGHTHPHNISDPAHSSLHSEPVRRSLRRLGVKPDTPGLPYYAPAKQRTPRKDSTMSQQIEQEESMITEEVEEENVKSDQIHINELSCSPRSVHVVTMQYRRTQGYSSSFSSSSLSFGCGFRRGCQ